MRALIDLRTWFYFWGLSVTLKWPCARNTGRSGSGKNQKSWFFLLALKYTLRTSFEPKKFLLKSCPELSNQVLFQPVKFSSSFEFVCRTIFSTFWHLVVKFGYNKWFLSNKKNGVFPFRWIIGEIKKSLFQFFQKKFFLIFFCWILHF